MAETESAPPPAQPQSISLEEKKHFLISQVLPAMARHTSAHICSVIGVVDHRTGRHVGSALRCTHKGRPAVLTALHVIETAVDETHGFAISAGYGKPPFKVHGNVNVDPVGDLAVYFLPDDYPVEGLEFWPSGRVDPDGTKLSTDYLFLHGFPESQSYSSQLLQGVLSKSLPYGAMQRLENLPSDLEPFQFAIEYAPPGMLTESGTPADAVDPHGLSGSPVWRVGISGRTRSAWRPEDSLVVGVITQWRPDENILIATSSDRLPDSW